jgi:hypothetical protein
MRQTIKEPRVGPKGPGEYRLWSGGSSQKYASEGSKLCYRDPFYNLMEVIIKECDKVLNTKMALHLINKSRLQLANDGRLKITSADIGGAIIREYEKSENNLRHSPGIFGEFYRNGEKSSGGVVVDDHRTDELSFSPAFDLAGLFPAHLHYNILKLSQVAQIINNADQRNTQNGSKFSTSN